MRRWLPPVFLLLCCLAGRGGDLVVRVVDPAGRPVNDAVVTLYPGGRPAPPARPPAPTRSPSATCNSRRSCWSCRSAPQVSFPNFDNVRHHVYSFSPVRRFELRLYRARAGAQRPLRPARDRADRLQHPRRDDRLHRTSPTPAWARAPTRGAGDVSPTCRPAPVGRAVWHPYLRAPGQPDQLRVAAAATGRQRRPFAVKLRPPPRPAGPIDAPDPFRTHPHPAGGALCGAVRARVEPGRGRALRVVATTAERQVRGELVASGTVFDRLWEHAHARAQQRGRLAVARFRLPRRGRDRRSGHRRVGARQSEGAARPRTAVHRQHGRQSVARRR